VESISESMQKILETGRMGFKDALSVRGKLAFAEGQLFGRVAAPVTRLLSRWMMRKNSAGY